ncbi:hypothetical protein C8F04DRAFT_1087264 [Mycena alexandri]|uniref:F-box domain-containing protein n=1 Tax=Mycena alexandri TaxID=1745969 RepID=A0AAD6X757_9AGAR|nr:hypothetical protein C8F04DRAFT_1087264 [Mycena alexandri]
MLQSQRLPPELCELIIQELRDSPQDLRSCSLVCRGWMVLARGQMTLHVHYHYCYTEARPIRAFIDLVQSPTSTLFATARRISLRSNPERRWNGDQETHLPVLKMLPQFLQLRYLNLWCSFPADATPVRLPMLTHLRISGKFTSYRSFARFMSGFPALRDLALCDVSWESSAEDLLSMTGSFPTLQDLARYDVDWEPSDDFTFPHLELKTVTLSWMTLSWVDTVRSGGLENVLRSLWTPALTVYHYNHRGFARNYLQSLSNYLHHLGGHLQYLCLPTGIVQNQVCMLDFRHNTGLRHLEIENAVDISRTSRSLIWASADIECILANISPYCRLETLKLTVRNIGHSSSLWKPIPQSITELLNGQLATIPEIQFIVLDSDGLLADPVARKYFESVLFAALPNSASSKVVVK